MKVKVKKVLTFFLIKETSLKLGSTSFKISILFSFPFLGVKVLRYDFFLQDFHLNPKAFKESQRLKNQNEGGGDASN